MPLLVSLHIWSKNYKMPNPIPPKWCAAHNWAYIAPDFRGPNKTPQALGSDFAVQDIVDAVEWAKKKANIDPNRIYLLGGSGGGHMSLLMAGRHPEIWAGVAAFCPITDVAEWYRFHSRTGKEDRCAHPWGTKTARNAIDEVSPMVWGATDASESMRYRGLKSRRGGTRRRSVSSVRGHKDNQPKYAGNTSKRKTRRAKLLDRITLNLV